MKKLITTAAVIFTTLTLSAQTKDTFVLKSFPAYDEMGNYYEIRKSYDHIPTQQDSIAFTRESNMQISIWIDSVAKARTLPKKANKKSNKH